ncbi:MAG: MBL fold metallo-hydrolase [Euzebyales bacterium]|nr:MBL fold metallo-hydrolase [Euzebyales bacterium]
MSLTVHTHTAGETGLLVNSYLLESPDGVLAVDTSLLVSDTRAFKARLDALGKPLLGAFITHAHPDHFNGAVELAGGDDVEVYATPSVAQTIREIADDKLAQWSPMFGDEWPATTYYPNSAIADGEAVTLGGVTVRAHELGPGESHADAHFTVTTSDGGGPLGFIGDVAFDGTHAYTADGHTGAWLANLERLTAQLQGAALLYPGHGQPGQVELLAAQRTYLLAYREAVRDLADGGSTLNDDALAEVVLIERPVGRRRPARAGRSGRHRLRTAADRRRRIRSRG